MLSFYTLFILLPLCTSVHAFFRLAPPVLTQERADPIISPGKQSGHLHTFVGASGVGVTTSYEQLRASECTTSPVKQDLSAYWSPLVTFQFKNGSFLAVNPENQGQQIYYGYPYPNNVGTKAFPPGLKMVAGNSYAREQWQPVNAQQWIYYDCLRDAPDSDIGKFLGGFPTVPCSRGVRANVFFPTCGAVDDQGNPLTDSADHRSHMAYFVDGKCPSTHPIRYPELHYELYFSNTGRGVPNWEEGLNPKQPFVLSNGDPTGYGFHADFFNGWETSVLQAALDECDGGGSSGQPDTCKHFQLTSQQDMEACQHANLAAKNPDLHVEEQIYGVLQKLPGCVPITTSTNNAIWASKGTCNPETGEIVLPDGSIFDPNGTYEDLPESHPPAPDQQQDKQAAKSASALAGGATTVAAKRAVKTLPVEPTAFVERKRRLYQRTKRRIV